MLSQSSSLPVDKSTAVVVVIIAICTVSRAHFLALAHLCLSLIDIDVNHVLILSQIILYNVFGNPLSRLPGPWYTKWTSGVLKYHIVKGSRALYIHDLHHKYGKSLHKSSHNFHSF